MRTTTGSVITITARTIGATHDTVAAAGGYLNDVAMIDW